VHVDGDGAYLTGVAVHGCVGGQFGGAQDDVVGDRAAVEDLPQVIPDLTDLVGLAWVASRHHALR
jgi:hypothetical protein